MGTIEIKNYVPKNFRFGIEFNTKFKREAKRLGMTEKGFLVMCINNYFNQIGVK